MSRRPPAAFFCFGPTGIQAASARSLAWRVLGNCCACSRVVSTGLLQAFFALPAVLASEVLPLDSLTYPVPKTLLIGFSCADCPLFVCRGHSTPPLFGSKHGMGSVGFRWPYADILRVLARGAYCLFSSRKSHCRCTESQSRCARHIPCQRKCRCSRLGSVSSQRMLQWNRQPGIRPAARTVSSRRRIGGQWSSSMVTSPFGRSAIVVFPQSLTQASVRAGVSFGGILSFPQ